MIKTMKKLAIAIALIILSSTAKAETFEQWVKNAGVHADRQMSPDQSRQFFVDYYASQRRNFDPNAAEFNATAAAVEINMAILKDRKPDDRKCDTHENGTVTVCSDLWQIKGGKMWKTAVSSLKGNTVSYCNVRYGPDGTKNVAARGYYNIEAGGHERLQGIPC
jgi:hypothetical protein